MRHSTVDCSEAIQACSSGSFDEVRPEISGLKDPDHDHWKVMLWLHAFHCVNACTSSCAVLCSAPFESPWGWLGLVCLPGIPTPLALACPFKHTCKHICTI
jgi:hypothetical protein